MSEKDSIPTNDHESIQDQTKQEEAFVSKKAYQEVSSDMIKYKTEMKALRAELEQAKADEQTRVESEQMKNGEYQKLADSYKSKYEESEAKAAASRDRVTNLHKLHSVEKHIGGFERSEYAKIATNLDAIKIDDDGFIDEESLRMEVERIKQEHPALLKTSEKPTLPNNAPGESSNLSYNEAIKQCKSMKELKALMEKNGRA